MPPPSTHAPGPVAVQAPEPPRPDPDRLTALSHALAAVGDRWSLLLVAALLESPGRFGDLAQMLSGIAPNVLTDRLRRLQERGLVVAQPYSRRPTRYLYELTESGRELAGALRLLAGWGARFGDGDQEGSEPPRHEACGAPLEARWHCPVCQVPVDEPGDDPAPGVYYA